MKQILIKSNLIVQIFPPSNNQNTYIATYDTYIVYNYFY